MSKSRLINVQEIDKNRIRYKLKKVTLPYDAILQSATAPSKNFQVDDSWSTKQLKKCFQRRTISKYYAAGNFRSRFIFFEKSPVTDVRIHITSTAVIWNSKEIPMTKATCQRNIFKSSFYQCKQFHSTKMIAINFNWIWD